MKLQPTRGTVFCVPLDKIEPTKTGMGFGSEKSKPVPETPFRFKVVAVGQPYPYEGMMVASEVKVGDVVSLNFSNQTIRERLAEGSGFMLDNVWYYPVDFPNVFGVWDEENDARPDILYR